MQKRHLSALWLVAVFPFSAAGAQDLAAEVAELTQLVAEMREDYETRIAELESRLARAEALADNARRDAGEAYDLAEQTAIDQSAGSSAPNAFNPGIGAVLTGFYSNFDTGWEEIPGFVPAGEIGSGEEGFALGEAEINFKANIDSRFYGNLTFALAEGEVELEEAWVQTTSMPAGLSLTGGRFFSGAGYLNGFNLHAHDFAHRPLPYQAFFGGRCSVDGLQARWVAPTALLVELGAEFNWGEGYPATANAETAPGAWTLFAKVGGDVSQSHSWQAGISHIAADTVERTGELDEAFTGDSDLTAVDFVWKWAPDGNPNVRNAKFQAEYFRRSEDGAFDGIDYDDDQSGWYVQGVYQFRPLWRAGLRYDRVTAGSSPLLDGTPLEDPGRSSSRASAMLDWSPSEFSRLRLQYTNDRVFSATDHLWMLQYIMSLGAHGAHQF